MSRTRKDVPHKVKAARLGIDKSEYKDDCSLCLEQKGKSTDIITGFTAIFFAHEVKELEDFLAHADELGYAAETREITGYLGDRYSKIDYLFNNRRNESKFQGYLNVDRAIYSQPRGIKENVIYDIKGFNTAEDRAKARRIRSYSSASWEMIDSPAHVSTKKNIFNVVTVSKVVTRDAWSYHNHDKSESLSYILYGHCHCSLCEPKEKSKNARVRAVANELKNAFNNGNFDELEEIASELVSSHPNAYRDFMNC